MATIAEAMKNCVLCKQRDKESLSDHTQQFKVAREILEDCMGGAIALNKYVEAQTSHDTANDTEKSRLTKEANERLDTYLHLSNSDQRKCGTIIRNLNSQKSLKNDQFPKTIVDANSVLSNHQFDNNHNNNALHNPKKGSKNDYKDETEAEDQEKEQLALSFVQLEERFWCCGKKGHKSPQCH